PQTSRHLPSSPLLPYTTLFRSKNAVDVPFVADIHFNYKIALACVDAGVDKIRINPGNIGADENVRAVARACNAKNIPIRIGVNADRKSTRLNSSHVSISYAVFC